MRLCTDFIFGICTVNTTICSTSVNIFVATQNLQYNSQNTSLFGCYTAPYLFSVDTSLGAPTGARSAAARIGEQMLVHFQKQLLTHACLQFG